MDWWLWVLIGVVALAGESVSMALFLLYVGIAAFVAAALALLHVGSAAQIGVFIALSVLLIGLVRPRMLQALAGRVPHRALTNQGPLVDRLAMVTQAVTRDGGQIRVGNAEFWTARAHPPTEEIAVGQRVRVVYLDGLTAYVEPVPVTTEAPPMPAVPTTPEAAPTPATPGAPEGVAAQTASVTAETSTMPEAPLFRPEAPKRPETTTAPAASLTGEMAQKER